MKSTSVASLLALGASLFLSSVPATAAHGGALAPLPMARSGRVAMHVRQEEEAQPSRTEDPTMIESEAPVSTETGLPDEVEGDESSFDGMISSSMAEPVSSLAAVSSNAVSSTRAVAASVPSRAVSAASSVSALASTSSSKPAAASASSSAASRSSSARAAAASASASARPASGADARFGGAGKLAGVGAAVGLGLAAFVL